MRKHNFSAAGMSLLITATAGIGGAQASTESPSAQQPTVQRSNFLRLWTPEFMGRNASYTTAQLTAMAKRFDMIVTMPGKFTRHLALMKKANPALELAIYKNATFGHGRMAETMYAHDASGERIHAVRWPTTFLMDLANPVWGRQVATTCRAAVAESKYDYCYLDVLGNAPVITEGYVNELPVHEDGTLWTPKEWIRWTTAISRTTATTMGRPQYGNGLGTGVRYFDPPVASKPLIAPNKMVAAEGFARSARTEVHTYLTEADWKKDVDMIVDAERAGPGILTITKIWPPSGEASEQEKDTWHEFTLATFLLGDGGRSKFCFIREESPTAPLMEHPYNAIDPGTPTNAYRKVGGIYRRDYTRSVILVNPTTRSKRVPLTRSYTTLDGATVSGSVRLAPHTARILRF